MTVEAPYRILRTCWLEGYEGADHHSDRRNRRLLKNDSNRHATRAFNHCFHLRRYEIPASRERIRRRVVERNGELKFSVHGGATGYRLRHRLASALQSRQRSVAHAEAVDSYMLRAIRPPGARPQSAGIHPNPDRPGGPHKHRREPYATPAVPCTARRSIFLSAFLFSSNAAKARR